MRDVYLEKGVEVQGDDMLITSKRCSIVHRHPGRVQVGGKGPVLEAPVGDQPHVAPVRSIPRPACLIRLLALQYYLGTDTQYKRRGDKKKNICARTCV